MLRPYFSVQTMGLASLLHSSSIGAPSLILTNSKQWVRLGIRASFRVGIRGRSSRVNPEHTVCFKVGALGRDVGSSVSGTDRVRVKAYGRFSLSKPLRFVPHIEWRTEERTILAGRDNGAAMLRAVRQAMATRRRFMMAVIDSDAASRSYGEWEKRASLISVTALKKVCEEPSRCFYG